MRLIIWAHTGVLSLAKSPESSHSLRELPFATGRIVAKSPENSLSLPSTPISLPDELLRSLPLATTFEALTSVFETGRLVPEAAASAVEALAAKVQRVRPRQLTRPSTRSSTTRWSRSVLTTATAGRASSRSSVSLVAMTVASCYANHPMRAPHGRITHPALAGQGCLLRRAPSTNTPHRPSRPHRSGPTRSRGHVRTGPATPTRPGRRRIATGTTASSPPPPHHQPSRTQRTNSTPAPHQSAPSPLGLPVIAEEAPRTDPVPEGATIPSGVPR